MKKLLLAAVLAALAPAAHAEDGALLECGGHIIQTKNQPGTNILNSIISDNREFNSTPMVKRRMDNGEVATFLTAWRGDSDHSIQVGVWEKGDIFAGEDTDSGNVWSAKCRVVR